MQLLCLLIISVFASDEKETTEENSKPNILDNSILVKIEEDEYNKTKNSHYIGVSCSKQTETWRSYRWSKNEKRTISNGRSYKNEETSARASDTLARKLIANGEKGHTLNFPDDDDEMYPPKKSSDFIGVYYNTDMKRWRAYRHNKHENKRVYNGTYNDEETAAHASDALARKLIVNGEKGHKLNFPDDHIEVHREEKASQYSGVSYNKQRKTWCAQRWSKNENKTVHNGSYKDKETAAHATDTLARKLIKNGEKGHKLNFPDDDTDSEVYTENQKNKKKRRADFDDYQK